MPLGAATAAFLVVTFGFAPVVNAIVRAVARVRASGDAVVYGTYGFSGTWILGVIAASVAFAVSAAVTRRR